MYETYKEVFLQKETLAKTFDSMMENADALRSFVKAYDPGEILFVACGSSYWLSLSASLTMQRETGIRASAVKSGDIVMDEACYRKALRRPLVICPSRSGMTAETVIAATKLKEWYGAKVLVITEYEQCQVADLGDYVIRQPWANEVAMMQTRSFSSLYMSCVLLSAILSGNQSLIGDMHWYIENYDSLAQDVARRAERIGSEEFRGYEYLVSLGTGCQYGVAVEGGYIQLEIGRFRASYFATLEYRHGPFLTNDEKTLFALFSTGVQIEREKKVVSELKEGKGRVIVISDNEPFEEADWNFTLGRKIAPEVVALYGVMLMQGLSYYQALRIGVNPDHGSGAGEDPFIAEV